MVANRFLYHAFTNYGARELGTCMHELVRRNDAQLQLIDGLAERYASVREATEAVERIQNRPDVDGFVVVDDEEIIGPIIVMNKRLQRGGRHLVHLPAPESPESQVCKAVAKLSGQCAGVLNRVLGVTVPALHVSYWLDKDFLTDETAHKEVANQAVHYARVSSGGRVIYADLVGELDPALVDEESVPLDPAWGFALSGVLKPTNTYRLPETPSRQEHADGVVWHPTTTLLTNQPD